MWVETAEAPSHSKQLRPVRMVDKLLGSLMKAPSDPFLASAGLGMGWGRLTKKQVSSAAPQRIGSLTGLLLEH